MHLWSLFNFSKVTHNQICRKTWIFRELGSVVATWFQSGEYLGYDEFKKQLIDIKNTIAKLISDTNIRDYKSCWSCRGNKNRSFFYIFNIYRWCPFRYWNLTNYLTPSCISRQSASMQKIKGQAKIPMFELVCSPSQIVLHVLRFVLAVEYAVSADTALHPF